ncbi:MAG: hypothetical protein WCD12_01680 [Candidatus Binatus sp.]|jgi:hypothetical protein|uniref:hypothetical protein n=1 Tax=Candidatus Binatus sp. TaxID=2811406 RepID=UPI003C76357B
MTTSERIISEIEGTVQGHYGDWRIGIANDPSDRKTRMANTANISCWRQWAADSLADAQEIEEHFVDKKMMRARGSGALDSRTVFVYIF